MNMKKVFLVLIYIHASYRIFDMDHIINFIAIEAFAIYGLMVSLLKGKLQVKTEIVQFKVDAKNFSDN